ncbi:MAG: DegT/DnrJ/EryC1/StrS aminotransferase family protein [Candidatus Scalindua sp.]|jgi:perosamine synthetase|nr:DegT/DnrJ/EryC1/StrS aminotransferase family protein [Candidatus Scalindua sp.]
MSSTQGKQQLSLDKIPITKPFFNTEEEEAILNVIRSGWLVQGPQVNNFENKFKTFIGVRHALATTSCTTALHLALLAAGVKPDDEVLLPSFTFVATANAVEYIGAKPVLIDIDLNTFTIAPERIEEYLNRRHQSSNTKPRCMIPVSLFGLCADMKSINKIATEHGILVIEDAACGLGAERKGHHAGTEALAGVFSFHPRKSITTGEGGMLVTNDDNLAEAVRKMRDHGASKSDLERHLKEGGSLLPEYNMLGFNYRMTDLQGALGTVQIDKAETIIRGRQEAAARYDCLLQDIPEIRKPYTSEGHTHSYQSYVCLYKANRAELRGENSIDWDQVEEWNRERNRLMAALESSGISVRQGTHAVHTLGYYKRKYELNDRDYPMSYIADRLSITLPLYFGITEQDQTRVVKTLQTCIRQL